jgi:flagellar basal body-associated protein FliL
MDTSTWPGAILILGILLFVFLLIGVAAAVWLDVRKTNVTAQQEESLRQLVNRYEKLAENTLDAQQRVAADVAELRSRTASIEQILRTVE